MDPVIQRDDDSLSRALAPFFSVLSLDQCEHYVILAFKKNFSGQQCAQAGIQFNRREHGSAYDSSGDTLFTVTRNKRRIYLATTRQSRPRVIVLSVILRHPRPLRRHASSTFVQPCESQVTIFHPRATL
jgi:hypothetical protein